MLRALLGILLLARMRSHIYIWYECLPCRSFAIHALLVWLLIEAHEYSQLTIWLIPCSAWLQTQLLPCQSVDSAVLIACMVS